MLDPSCGLIQRLAHSSVVIEEKTTLQQNVQLARGKRSHALEGGKEGGREGGREEGWVR